MQRFVAELHAKGQRWIPIVDPGAVSATLTCLAITSRQQPLLFPPLAGIKVDRGYPAYDAGMQQDVFMRGPDGKPYLGWVRHSAFVCCGC